jgi:hypothetical protein
MTKFSGITPNSSPALADYFVGVTAGNVDDRVTLQNLMTLLQNNILLTTANIDWAAATGKVWWQELGRGTLASAAPSLSSSTFTARKYLRVLVIARTAGSILTPWIRFNNDSGANYALRYGANFAAGAALGSQNGFSMNANSISSDAYCLIDIINETAKEKIVFLSASDQGAAAGAANGPNNIQSSAKWANTANQITSVQLFESGAANNFAAGSEIIVLGHD